VALLVAGVTLVIGSAAAEINGSAPAGADSPLTPTQVVGALGTLASSYPGGLAALGGLFDTGPCAGVVDATTLAATPACAAVISQVQTAAAGVTSVQPLPQDGTTDTNTLAVAPQAGVAVKPASPGLLVAFGDSVTSGHHATPDAVGFNALGNPTPSVTTCDDPQYSYANALATLLGVAPASYTNVAHSGATTDQVLNQSPFTNSCGQTVQPAASGTEVAQAAKILSASPSQGKVVNVAVGTGGANDANWVPILTGLILTSLGQPGKAPAGTPLPTPAQVANQNACKTYVFGQWTGPAMSGQLAVNVATIALNLISADPGAFVRYVGYYDFGTGSPTVATFGGVLNYLPTTCSSAITAGVGFTNGVQRIGITAAKIIRLLSNNDPSRIGWVDPQCAGAWNPAAPFMQVNLVSYPPAPNNTVLVPGYPHPSPQGMTAIANCVNLSLPRTVAGDLVPLGGTAAPPPVTPEAPLALLLPLVGLVGLAGWMVRRRVVVARRTA
jgi:hypothetical protein